MKENVQQDVDTTQGNWRAVTGDQACWRRGQDLVWVGCRITEKEGALKLNNFQNELSIQTSVKIPFSLIFGTEFYNFDRVLGSDVLKHFQNYTLYSVKVILI